MTPKTKQRIYLFVGLAISALLIYLLFENVDFAELKAALSGANYWWLIPNVLIIFFTMYQRAYRWKYMVAPLGEVPFRKLLAATWIGFMANNVLPFRLGEFVRAYSLSSQHPKITKSASLATIFTERMVFDLVALLAIFVAVLVTSDITFMSEDADGERMRMGLAIAVGIALAGVIFVLIMARRPEKARRLVSKYLSFLPDKWKDSIDGIISKFATGLDFLGNARAVFSIAVQTLAIWILMGLSNVFVFWAFGFDLPLEASFMVLVAVSLSILIPAAPGFVGVYHAAAVWALGKYGVGLESALSCALVLHAAQYIVVTGMGLIYMSKEHLSLKRLEEVAEDA